MAARTARYILSGFLKFHLGFGRVDIDINGRGRKGDEEDDDGKLVAGEDTAIGIQNGFIDHPIFDKALVDIEDRWTPHFFLKGMGDWQTPIF